MKKSLLSLACVAALALSSMAPAQTIPTPAGSTDSGARGVVAITPVEISQFATKIDVDNSNAYSASLYYQSIDYTDQKSVEANNYTNAKYGDATAYSDRAAVWSKWFPNASRSSYGTLGQYDVWMDANGYMYLRSYLTGTIGIGYGYTGSNFGLVFSNSCRPCINTVPADEAYDVVEIAPSADSSYTGQPYDWYISTTSHSASPGI